MAYVDDPRTMNIQPVANPPAGLSCDPTQAAAQFEAELHSRAAGAGTDHPEGQRRLAVDQCLRWRFMSPDPLPWIHLQHGNDSEQKKFAAFIASPQNFNMYAYVNNNPLSKTDPTGMNACGPNDDSNCKVTVTIQDRSRDANGNYNDRFTGEKYQQNYDATATVSVNGKQVGTFPINTTPSDCSKYATIQDGTYTATLVTHDGKPALALNGGGPVPVVGGKDPATGLPYATGALIHSAGIGNYTGMYFSQKIHAMAGVSEGCQTVCTSEYGRFLQAVGVQGQVGTPQGRFTVTLDTSENQ